MTFVVTNAGTETGEFEVVQAGTRVIDEVENIVPGFVINMATRVDGGTYELVCGNLQAPRGTLTVTGGAAATSPPNTVVDQATLDAARDRYATYVTTQVTDLVTAIAAFTAAVESGDVAKAKSLYAAARIPWEASSPSPSCSPISTRRSTSARRTSTAESTIPGSRASTGSRKCSSPMARPRVSARSPSSCARTSTSSRSGSMRSSSTRG